MTLQVGSVSENNTFGPAAMVLVALGFKSFCSQPDNNNQISRKSRIQMPLGSNVKAKCTGALESVVAYSLWFSFWVWRKEVG